MVLAKIATLLLLLASYLSAQETGRYFAALWPEGCTRVPRESCWTYAYLPEEWMVEKATEGPSWAYRMVAAPGTNPGIRELEILPGSGLQITAPFPGESAPIRLAIDPTYLLHIAGIGPTGMPVDGSPCYNGAGLWLSQETLVICTPSSSWPSDGSPWIWRRWQRAVPSPVP